MHKSKLTSLPHAQAAAAAQDPDSLCRLGMAHTLGPVVGAGSRRFLTWVYFVRIFEVHPPRNPRFMDHLHFNLTNKLKLFLHLRHIILDHHDSHP
jgi:hypothetical protein